VLYGLYTGIAAVGLYTWWKGWRASRGPG
jgi:hypothetical protein